MYNIINPLSSNINAHLLRTVLHTNQIKSNHCFIVTFAVGRLKDTLQAVIYVLINTLHLLTRLIFKTNKI